MVYILNFRNYVLRSCCSTNGNTFCKVAKGPVFYSGSHRFGVQFFFSLKVKAVVRLNQSRGEKTYITKTWLESYFRWKSTIGILNNNHVIVRMTILEMGIGISLTEKPKPSNCYIYPFLLVHPFSPNLYIYFFKTILPLELVRNLLITLFENNF